MDSSRTPRKFRSSGRLLSTCAWAFVSVGGILSACSSGTNSGASTPSAGAPAAGMPSAAAGAASGGSSFTAAGTAGTSMGLGGTNAAGGTPGNGGAGASAGGTAGAAPGGGAGNTSTGGGGASGSGAGGSPAGGGLGGMTNDLGTITGSPAIAKLLALTQNCTTANQIANSHTYKLDNGSTTSICSLKGGTGNAGGAIFYTADMDIDCDGLTTDHCPGTGPDMDCCYQDMTSFHGPNSGSNKDGTSLASENTPYVVIPQDVKFPGLDQNNGGNIIAVIYNNQLEFGVFGDQGPSDIAGEASVRTANGLGIPSSPASGGVGAGVTYIVFVGTGSKPADMENISQIQTLGAQLTESLLQNNQ